MIFVEVRRQPTVPDKPADAGERPQSDAESMFFDKRIDRNRRGTREESAHRLAERRDLETDRRRSDKQGVEACWWLRRNYVTSEIPPGPRRSR